jgi:outer membrane protein
MFPVRIQILCLALTLAAASSAGAAEQEGPPEGEESKSYSWGLGLAGLSQQQGYAGIDRENIAIPVIYFENRWVQLFGPWLDIKLPELEWSEDQKFSSGVRAQLFGFNGYEADDAPILNGMEDRKNGIFAGPFAKWSNSWVDVSLEWMLDASGNSEGQRMTFGLEKQFHVGEHLMFTPSVTATWMDDKYVDYYYGVRATEARLDRPAYVADGTMNTDISLRTDYMFDQHHAVFGMLQYTALGSEIKDSPLTDRSSETMVLVGYMYRF